MQGEYIDNFNESHNAFKKTPRMIGRNNYCFNFWGRITLQDSQRKRSRTINKIMNKN